MSNLTHFPSAATRVPMSSVISAALAACGGGTNVQFNRQVAEMLGHAESHALASLMRNTCLVMHAVKKLRPGQAVILPRYSCPSFIHGIQAAGVPYRYCDLDAPTLSITADVVEQAGTIGAGALLVSNLFGLSADMISLEEYCARRNLLLVDAADYTFGGVFAGRLLGSFGAFAILNFQEGKALPIGGGMALAKQNGALPAPEPARIGTSLVAFLRCLAFSIFIRPHAYGLLTRVLRAAGIEKKKLSMEDTIRSTRNEFDYVAPASALLRGISPFQSSLGLNLLRRLDRERAARMENASILEAALADIPGCRLIPRHRKLEVCHYIRYPVLIAEGRREAVCQTLIEAGFEASPMYIEHGMKIDSGQYPGAARVCAELLTLPCHSFLKRTDLVRMAGMVRRMLCS